MFDPRGDGIDHINIYTKGSTSLGRFLSNMSSHTIYIDGSFFDTIEGYWHWLGFPDVEEFTKLNGFECLKLSKKLRKEGKVKKQIPDFKRKIKKAIRRKIASSKFKDLFFDSTLPFKHYYVYGGKVIEPKESQWIVEFLENLRSTFK